MPSLAATLPPYYDTCERTSRARRQTPKEIDPNWANVSSSRILTQNDLIQGLLEAISELSLLPENWNGYGSPRPSLAAIRKAKIIVERFRATAFQPEKVTASADGGVGFIFVGREKRRAVIESFGTEEDYVLFYDTDGNSHTSLWPKEEAAQCNLLNELQTYLRGL
jgi:hypothetical protein